MPCTDDGFWLVMIRTILLFIAFGFATGASAQWGTKRYYFSEGLDCNAVYKARQGNNGIMWLATDNGLYSFDGRVFVRHSYEALQDDEILNIKLFQDGLFLFPFNTNIAYVENGKLVTKHENPELDKIKASHGNNVGYTLKYDPVSKTSIFYNAGLDKNLHLYKEKKVTLLNIEDVIPKPLSYYDSKALFFTKDQRLIEFDVKSSTTRHLKEFPKIEDHIVEFRMKGDLLLVHTRKEVRLYKKQEGRFIGQYDRITYKNKKPQWFYNIEIGTNEVWLAGEDKLFRYDAETKELKQYFKDALVNGTSLDKDENIWVVTKNKGLIFWDRREFESYTEHNFRAIEKINVNRITGSDSTIYFGMGDSKAGVYTNDTTRVKTLNFDRARMINVIDAKKDKVFFGGDHGLIITDNRLNELTAPLKHNGNRINAIKSIADDYNKKYKIVSGPGTAYKLNCSTYEMIPIFKRRTMQVLQYTKDSAYLSTNMGLYKAKLKSKEFKEIIPGHNFLYGAFNTNRTIYAFASNSNGLFYIKNNTIKQLNKANGLIDNNIKKLIFESEHVLWALSNSGISKIEFKDSDEVPAICRYTQTNDLPENRLNDFHIQNGKLFIAHTEGIRVVDMEKLSESQNKSVKVVLNHMDISGVREQPSLEPRFPYTTENIVFNVSYPDYGSLGNVRFKYKLNDQKEFQYINDQEIVLSALQPGKHVLTIYGVDSSNVDSETPLTVNITITPMFWQTTWFKALVLIVVNTLLILGIFLLYRRYTRRRQLALELKNKLNDLEIRVIKSQINPHFVANCLNSIKLFMYKRDYEKSQIYIDNFAIMLRFNLEYSQKTFVTVADEIKYLEAYVKLEKLRFNELFNYSIFADDVSLKLSIPTFFVQPFIENAIKHAFNENQQQAGSVVVEFKSLEVNSVQISIVDNGIGIDKTINKKSKSKDSLGMKLLQERIQSYMHNFRTPISLSVRDRNYKAERGTEVIISIACNNGIQSRHR